MRPSGRAFDQLRDIVLETNVNKHAEGSCLPRFGETHVLCTASIEQSIPSWLRNSGRRWITAEYGMLTHSPGPRTAPQAAPGNHPTATYTIQRPLRHPMRPVTSPP